MTPRELPDDWELDAEELDAQLRILVSREEGRNVGLVDTCLVTCVQALQAPGQADTVAVAGAIVQALRVTTAAAFLTSLVPALAGVVVDELGGVHVAVRGLTAFDEAMLARGVPTGRFYRWSCDALAEATMGRVVELPDELDDLSPRDVGEYAGTLVGVARALRDAAREGLL